MERQAGQDVFRRGSHMPDEPLCEICEQSNYGQPRWLFKLFAYITNFYPTRSFSDISFLGGYCCNKCKDALSPGFDAEFPPFQPLGERDERGWLMVRRPMPDEFDYRSREGYNVAKKAWEAKKHQALEFLKNAKSYKIKLFFVRAYAFMLNPLAWGRGPYWSIQVGSMEKR